MFFDTDAYDTGLATTRMTVIAGHIEVLGDPLGNDAGPPDAQVDVPIDRHGLLESFSDLVAGPLVLIQVFVFDADGGFTVALFYHSGLGEVHFAPPFLDRVDLTIASIDVGGEAVLLLVQDELFGEVGVAGYYVVFE